MGSPVVPRHSISQAAAQVLIDRALQRAGETERNVAIAVVDSGGALVGFARMDEAKLSTIQVATDKAYTSATTRKSTDEWWEYIKDDPPLVATLPQMMERIVVFGGGRPILLDGQCVGGIGVSGSHYTGDMDISAYALEGFGTE